MRRWISIVGGKPGPNRLIVLSACITDNDAVNVMAAMIASKFGIRLKIVRVRFLQFGFPNSLLSDEDLTIDLMLHPEEMVESLLDFIPVDMLDSRTNQLEKKD